MRLFTLLYHIPVFGWMLRSAAKGDDSERILFLVDLVMIWVMAAIFFGLPAVIYPAVVFAIGFIVFLVVFTAGDLRTPEEEPGPHDTAAGRTRRHPRSGGVRRPDTHRPTAPGRRFPTCRGPLASR